MTPGVVGQRLVGCFLWGVLLGAAADVFKPLHRRLPRLSELLIGLELLFVWLHSSFALCRGELRVGFYLALLLGAGLWEQLFGEVAGALWRNFWHFAVLPGKFLRKFFRKIANFLFSSWKKWSTIQKNNRPSNHPNSGGTPHGRHPRLFKPLSAPRGR